MSQSQPAPKGFKSVFDFGASRSWQAALGFYAFYFVIGLLAAGICSVIAEFVSHSQTYDEAFAVGKKVGQIFGVIMCTSIYVLIIQARKAWGNPRYIAALAATALLSFMGAALALIIPAVTLGWQPSKDPDVIS